MVDEVEFGEGAEGWEVEYVAFNEFGFGVVFDVVDFAVGEVIVCSYVCA